MGDLKLAQNAVVTTLGDLKLAQNAVVTTLHDLNIQVGTFVGYCPSKALQQGSHGSTSNVTRLGRGVARGKAWLAAQRTPPHFDSDREMSMA